VDQHDQRPAAVAALGVRPVQRRDDAVAAAVVQRQLQALGRPAGQLRQPAQEVVAYRL
jgi:hypothetical protein